jgi:hypothetical protein
MLADFLPATECAHVPAWVNRTEAHHRGPDSYIVSMGCAKCGRAWTAYFDDVRLSVALGGTPRPTGLREMETPQ